MFYYIPIPLFSLLLLCSFYIYPYHQSIIKYQAFQWICRKEKETSHMIYERLSFEALYFKKFDIPGSAFPASAGILSAKCLCLRRDCKFSVLFHGCIHDNNFSCTNQCGLCIDTLDYRCRSHHRNRMESMPWEIFQCRSDTGPPEEFFFCNDGNAFGLRFLQFASCVSSSHHQRGAVCDGALCTAALFLDEL